MKLNEDKSNLLDEGADTGVHASTTPRFLGLLPLLWLILGLLLPACVEQSGSASSSKATDVEAADVEAADVQTTDVQAADVFVADGVYWDGPASKADNGAIDAHLLNPSDAKDVTNHDGGAIVSTSDSASTLDAPSADVDALEDTTNKADTTIDGTLADGVLADGELPDGELPDGELPDGTPPQDGALTDTSPVNTGDTAHDSGVSDAGDAAQDTSNWTDLAPLDAGPVTPVASTTLPLAAFTDVTALWGIKPTQVHGPCLSAGDLNGDGFSDVVVIERNNGTATIHALLLGKSKPVHVKTAFDLTLIVPEMGCALVDINDDGKLDLLIGGYSGAALYVGDGKGAFVDKTTKFLPYIMDFAAWTLVPVDLDGDGDLDIFIGAGGPEVDVNASGPVCGAHKCSWSGGDFQCLLAKPTPATNANRDRVLIRGPTGVLVDATKTWNVPTGGSMTSALAADFNGDGKVDLIVGDDFGAVRLLLNTGNGFQVHVKQVGFHPYVHAMGLTIGDFNDDGRADLVLADLGPSLVYRQTATVKGAVPLFQEIGTVLGLAPITWGSSAWTPIVADFDQDGRDDILMGSTANIAPKWLGPINEGCPAQISDKVISAVNSADFLLLSSGGGAKVGQMGYGAFRISPGKSWSFMAQAQVVVDIDGDGDLDVIQTKAEQKLFANTVRVLRNDLPNKGKYVWVRLNGKKGNAFAVGAMVSGKAKGVLRTRWLNGSGGFGGTPLAEAHFGLGQATKLTDVTVRWPDGKTTTIGSIKAGATVTVTWPK